MNFVKQAAILNAEGVHALTLGNAMVAHQSFSQALRALSHATQLSGQTTYHGDNGWHKAIVSAWAVPELGGNRDDDGFYVCNSALLFTLNEEQVIDSPTVVICCYCAMFNTALCFHQRGMLTGTRSNFMSAARLYEKCLLLGAEIDGPVNDLNILTIANCTNLAHLQAILGDFDKALENLETVKHLVPDTDVEKCVSPGFAHVLQIDEIILNVLVTSRPQTAACA
jgi:hypothetical protein